MGYVVGGDVDEVVFLEEVEDLVVEDVGFVFLYWYCEVVVVVVYELGWEVFDG